MQDNNSMFAYQGYSDCDLVGRANYTASTTPVFSGWFIVEESTMNTMRDLVFTFESEHESKCVPPLSAFSIHDYDDLLELSRNGEESINLFKAKLPDRVEASTNMYGVPFDSDMSLQALRWRAAYLKSRFANVFNYMALNSVEPIVPIGMTLSRGWNDVYIVINTNGCIQDGIIVK